MDDYCNTSATMATRIYHLVCFLCGASKKQGEQRTAGQVMTELANVLLDFFRKRHIVYYLFFIILYRFAEGFVMKIVPLFLKASRETGGLGLTEKRRTYYGTVQWQHSFWDLC